MSHTIQPFVEITNGFPQLITTIGSSDSATGLRYGLAVVVSACIRIVSEI